MTSVNTNHGAMAALQSLDRTRQDYEAARARISTGKRIGSPKDNGAVWAIAQNQRAAVRSLDVVRESLQRGISTVDVALGAGEAIIEVMLQMKQHAHTAFDTSTSSASRAALESEYQEFRRQIRKISDNASFNGRNLTKFGGAPLNALANAGGTSAITVSSQDLAIAAFGFQTTTIATVFQAGMAQGVLDVQVGLVARRMATLATGARTLAAHSEFVGKLQDAMNKGIGSLVDADLAKESARVQALEARQQLGVSALAIANRRPAILTSLFA